MSCDLDAAARFAAAFGDLHTWQTYDDDKKRRDRRLAHIFHGGLEDCARDLVRLNERGAGVSLTINETDLTGRLTENITRARAMFVDFDDGPPPTLPLPPSVIVQSVRGPHCYWLLKPSERFLDASRIVTTQVPLPLWNRVQLQLARKLGGDTSCADWPRAMRCPGFLHRKAEPKPVTLLHCDPSLQYTIEEFADAFGLSLAPPPPPAPSPSLPHALQDRLKRCGAFLARCDPAVEGDGGYARTKGICGVGHDFGLEIEEFWPLLLDWNTRCSPPWEEEELRKKLERIHFLPKDNEFGWRLEQDRGGPVVHIDRGIAPGPVIGSIRKEGARPEAPPIGATRREGAVPPTRAIGFAHEPPRFDDVPFPDDEFQENHSPFDDAPFPIDEPPVDQPPDDPHAGSDAMDGKHKRRAKPRKIDLGNDRSSTSPWAAAQRINQIIKYETAPASYDVHLEGGYTLTALSYEDLATAKRFALICGERINYNPPMPKKARDWVDCINAIMADDEKFRVVKFGIDGSAEDFLRMQIANYLDDLGVVGDDPGDLSDPSEIEQAAKVFQYEGTYFLKLGPVLKGFQDKYNERISSTKFARHLRVLGARERNQLSVGGLTLRRLWAFKRPLGDGVPETGVGDKPRKTARGAAVLPLFTDD